MNALSGKRILVIEDEYFIASDLANALKKEGAVPLGPVGDVAAGLKLAEDEAIDCALLDVNLGEANSLSIADRLRARAIPCILLTGYDQWHLPEAYRDIPHMEKPLSARQVMERLDRLIGSRAVA